MPETPSHALSHDTRRDMCRVCDKEFGAELRRANPPRWHEQCPYCRARIGYVCRAVREWLGQDSSVFAARLTDWAVANAESSGEPDRVECPLCFDMGRLGGYLSPSGLSRHLRRGCGVFRKLEEENEGRRIEREDRERRTMLARTSDPVFAYLIRCEGTGRLKIGHSVRPPERLRGITSPHPLTLLGMLPEGDAEERRLHARFAHLRRHGEWFDPHPDIYAAFGLAAPAMGATHA